MKIALIYFSATNNTATIANYIKKELGNLDENLRVDEFDITRYSDRQHKPDISQYKAIFFGFPIYAWRAPRLVREWLQNLDGNGKKCSVFFTYGGVDTGGAHYNTKLILEKQNFHLVSTAEFPCKNTYNCGGWKLMADRPNKSDFNVAKEYTEETYKRFFGNDNGIVQIKNPNISDIIFLKLEQFVNNAFKPPSRKNVECSLCKTCENDCPVNAMNADLGEANPNICIRCYRCFINCPEKALKIEDLYPKFLKFSKFKKMPTDESKVVSKFFV